jgi:hypothetical protein
MSRRSLLWFCLSLFIGIFSITFYSVHIHAPLLANDSYQYLDAAAHFASGSCLCTDFAHFDEQVNWGHMPIPFTHFGPGYPIAIAFLRLFGIPVETGGFLLTVAGYLLVISCIWLTGYYLEVQPWSIVLVCALWSLNSIALDFGTAVATDCLFTAIVTALCAIIAYDVRNLARPRPLLLLLLGALVGSAYWLRQPGLFLLLPLYLYLSWRGFVQPPSQLYALAGAALAALLVAPVILRNIVLVHSWNSGFANGRHTPWKLVVSDTLKAPYHIVFGVASVARFDMWIALFFFAALVLLWRAVANYRNQLPFTRLPEASVVTLTWMLVFAVAFSFGILVAELSTYAASEVRYNFPIFSIVLIACAVVFQFASDRIGRIAAILCVLSVILVNNRSSFAGALRTGQSTVPAALLQQQIEPGLSMRSYLETALPHDAILLATDGQAVYYLLKRPTVSIIEPQYSLHIWDGPDVHSVMRNFGAQYFLVFPGADKLDAPEQESSPFLHSLTQGHPPSWLSVAARTPGTLLYRCADCAKPALSGASLAR